MTKEELKEKLENELTKKIRKRRIITGSVFIVFLVIGILFTVLRESSKEIIIHGDIFKWEEVVYKHDYLFFILTGFLGAVFAFCVLFLTEYICAPSFIKKSSKAINLIQFYHNEKKLAILLYIFLL